MKGFSFHINPRHKHLYLVAAFLGVMLTAGLTVGFMTGKLINPFNKAYELEDTETTIPPQSGWDRGGKITEEEWKEAKRQAEEELVSGDLQPEDDSLAAQDKAIHDRAIQIIVDKWNNESQNYDNTGGTEENNNNVNIDTEQITREEAYLKGDYYDGSTYESAEFYSGSSTGTNSENDESDNEDPGSNTPGGQNDNGEGGGTTTGASSSSTSDCDPSYLIPLTISSATVDTSSCSNDTYTVKYTIKIHADNADKKECGGGHFTLTATFPSTVKFGSGSTASASPSASASNNVVTWADRYVYDNSDQTFTLTANIPKTQITSSTLNTTFKITLGDHTKDGGTLQTTKSSNVGTCYVTGTTSSGTSTDTTSTGTSDSGTTYDNTYYSAPNTGLLDEHPILIVAFISGLAILESVFGIFSKTIISLKKFVD